MSLAEMFNRPGRGIDPNAPKKKGIELFFEILWREFWELMKLNLLFLLFCLPIFTIPAAMTAMSGITLTMVRDENHFLWRDFLRVFKREFGRSLGAGWLVLFGMAATCFGVFFYSRMTDMGWFRLVPSALGAVGFLILYCMSFYVFPQLAVLNVPVKALLKNAFLLTFVCMRRNVITFLVTAVLLVLGFGLLPYSIPAFALLLLSACSLVVSFHAYPAMRQYLVKQSDLDGESADPDRGADAVDWKTERERLGKDEPAK